MTVRFTLALAAVVLLPPLPATGQPKLQGDWLGFAATAINLGLVVPVMEQLQIRGDLAQQQGWTVPLTQQGCTGTDADPPACAPPVPLGAVVLTLQGDRVAAVPDGPQGNPYTHPVDSALWPLVGLAGHDWLLRGDDRRVILSREAVIEGEPLTLERIYYRAPPGTAGQLFDYLFTAELSIARAVCGIDALHDSPADWDAFLAHVARLHPVTAELRRIAQMAQRSRDDQLRALTLRHGPQALGDSAADVSDLPESARTAWLDFAANQRDAADRGPDWLDSLAFDATPELAERASACIAYFMDF